MTIVTWNMQGLAARRSNKPVILEQLLSAGYDVVCCQEATAPLDTFVFEREVVDGLMRYRRGVPRQSHVTRSVTAAAAGAGGLCYYTPWGKNPRCSMAVYTRAAVIDSGLEPIGSRRPMLWLRLENCYVASVHLTSGACEDAKTEFVAAIHGINTIRTNARVDRPFYIVGDFNVAASEMEHLVTAELGMDGHHIHCCGEATHSGGKEYDFCFSDSTAAVHTRLFRLAESDHEIVVFTV